MRYAPADVPWQRVVGAGGRCRSTSAVLRRPAGNAACWRRKASRFWAIRTVSTWRGSSGRALNQTTFRAASLTNRNDHSLGSLSVRSRTLSGDTAVAASGDRCGGFCVAGRWIGDRRRGRGAGSGDLTPEEARAEFVQALCCVGAPIPFNTGLVRLVAAMQREYDLDASAEILNAMLSGSHNIEPWLQPGSGLVGFLTPGEVYSIHTAWVAADLRALRRVRLAGRRRRRGGVLGPVLRLLQHLRAGGPQPDETFRLLFSLLEDAVGSADGIAAMVAS